MRRITRRDIRRRPRWCCYQHTAALLKWCAALRNWAASLVSTLTNSPPGQQHSLTLDAGMS